MIIKMHQFCVLNQQIDGKKKPIPRGTSVKHGVAWNQEMDLNDYYTDIDRKFY